MKTRNLFGIASLFIIICCFALTANSQPFNPTAGYYGPVVTVDNSAPIFSFFVNPDVMITNVRVRINVTCPDNGAEFGFMISTPTGDPYNTVPAFSMLAPLYGSNFINTIFDETAPITIYDPSQSGPYTGVYNTHCEGFGWTLTRLNGTMSRGNWSVQPVYRGAGICTFNSIEIEINGGGSLPVELTSFTASGLDQMVKLNWKTESELDNAYYNIYRSTARDQQGELIARIDGMGTSSTGRAYTYTDNRVTNGTVYYYRLADVSTGGEETVKSTVATATPQKHATGAVPVRYSLNQNFPNPFNPTTDITYGIKKAGNVRLTIFDQMGREVRTLVNELQSPNTYCIHFNATGLPSGTYYYTLTTQDFTTTKQMVLMK